MMEERVDILYKLLIFNRLQKGQKRAKNDV